MEFNHLRIFADAAQTLSFSETAQRLHTTQPTVSKHIKELENELDVTLFKRATGSKLRLTQEGMAMLPWAQQLVRECNKFYKTAHSLNAHVMGTLSVECATASGKYILPLLAARFRARFPDVQIRIRPCAPAQIGQDLLDQNVDFGIISHENHAEGLECQKFITDEIILIAPTNHPWASHDTIEAEDLLGEPILLREPTAGTRRVVASALAEHDIMLDDLNMLLELASAEGIIHMVAFGVGVAFVPRSAAKLVLESGKAREIPIAEVHIEKKICMLRNSLKAPSRPAELFWGFIHDPENEDLFIN